MAIRRFKQVDLSFDYDFTRDGGAVGFLGLGQGMAANMQLIETTYVTNVTVVGPGSTITIGIPGLAITLPTGIGSLVFGRIVRVDPTFQTGVAAPGALGIEIIGAPITAGSFMVRIIGSVFDL